MPFVDYGPELWKRLISRVLIFGPPNSFKTSSLLTWLPCGPMHLISYPGESGYATIPLGVTNLKSYIWEGDVISRQSPTAMVAEVQKLTIEVLAGKRGPITTIALDGIHKFADLILDDLTGGAYGRGEEFSTFLYPRAGKVLKNYVQMINQSPVQNVVFTAWNHSRPDKKGEILGGQSHEWPALPGEMAKLILGEFSIVVFSRVIYPRTATEKMRGEWLLRPDNEVWGSMVKIDPRVAVQLPSRVPQDWTKLEPLLLKAYEKGTQGEDSQRVA